MDYLDFKKDFDTERGARNIIIFLDGTWNDESGRENDGVVTNVYKLFTAMEGKLEQSDVPLLIESDKQVAMYFRGIGNDDENGLISEYYGGVFGAGERDIRNHAYVHIIKHYRPGDRIIIFGFSRGAACARLLANKIAVDGIPDSVRFHYLRQRNRSNGKMETRYRKYSRASSTVKKPNIQFLGLWDTVGAFGVPVDIGPLKLQKLNLFKDLTVSKKVLHGTHIVAIDENRDPFIPTLVNETDHIEEVWFPGVHSDIGGGFFQDEIGAMTLRYMIRSLEDSTQTKRVRFDEERKAEITKKTGNARYLHIKNSGPKRSRRQITVLRNDQPSDVPPKIHASVFDMISGKMGVFLAEEFDSYIKPSPALYAPKAINGLRGRYKKVGEPDD